MIIIVGRVTQKNTGSCGNRDGGPKACRLSWNRFPEETVPESSSKQTSQVKEKKGLLDRETALVMETESGSSNVQGLKEAWGK